MERQNLIIRRQKQKQRAETDFYADTMEREKTRKALSDINREKGVFINRFEEGLNREESIFDSTAVFRMK